MKQKKEQLAFNCSPHQAHLLRRYAASIMTPELDIDAEVKRRVSMQNRDLFALQRNQLAQQQALNPLQRAQGEPCGYGLASLLGGLGRLF